MIWAKKNDLPIVFIDIEKRLERKPTMFADSRQLPFQDSMFHTVFFDPPHAWAFDSMFYSFPNEQLLKAQYATVTRNGIPSYYGMERYRTKTQLLSYLFHTEKELYRVTMFDGIMWLKWNELRISLDRVLVVFKNWVEVLRLEISDNHQQLSKIQTYWIAFLKKTKGDETMPLDTCFLNVSENQGDLIQRLNEA